MSKFLVIHQDQSGQNDVAEVESDSPEHAVSVVQAYPDTLKVYFAVEFVGEPPKVFGVGDFHNAFIGNGQVTRLGATEGDALEAEAE